MKAICLQSTGHRYCFSSPINYEHSSGLVATISKNAKSEMELFATGREVASTGEGVIEWVYNVDSEDEDVEHIGVTWEDGQLLGYDGVFDLPVQAIQLLKQAGIRVGKDFCPEI